ncbi:hypothetical protein [Marinobacterium jannaschii]|uniref:hypothetical protein n=1 Tax=Marinobacterium jannaschii TaxID=64970 RepID=UPI00047F3D18|nr:hypothetical protein [Marinobacterium jannaschii]
MTIEIPKYVATPEYGEECISFFGAGDTPDEALANFIAQPIRDYAKEVGVAAGEDIEVQIWTAGTAAEAGWSESEAPDFSWFLLKKLDTKNVVLQKNFDNQIALAMQSCSENYIAEVIDSIEFEIHRKLSDEEHDFVEKEVRRIISNDTKSLEEALDNAHNALQCVLVSGAADPEVEDMIQRGLNNRPQKSTARRS